MEYLQEKNLLLVLTRCERVLGACAQLVGTILRTCPDVYVVGVSEMGFGVDGERTLQAVTDLQ
jgi:non-specific serine/threonine protein kinase